MKPASDDYLRDLRSSIDNLDNALVAILAERFRLTEKVGVYKANRKMSTEDPEREASQIERLLRLSESYGLDGDVLTEVIKAVIGRVKMRHEEIKAQVNNVEAT